jgi:P27 family predicted phage terminase small subunit
MSGPPPKPTALKKLAGNPGGKRLNEREARPPIPAKRPYAPRFLCSEGQREWRRVVGVLIELGLYTVIDQAALALYCQAYGRWTEAERQIEATGGPVLTGPGPNGGLWQNPWVAQANRAFDQLRKMLAEFGLSPAQRSRVVAAAQADQLSLAELLFQDVSGD